MSTLVDQLCQEFSFQAELSLQKRTPVETWSLFSQCQQAIVVEAATVLTFVPTNRFSKLEEDINLKEGSNKEVEA